MQTADRGAVSTSLTASARRAWCFLCSFVGVDAKCSRACLEQSPRFLPSGVADCHIYVVSDPNEGCPESRGLMPSSATVPDMNGPVCEIRRLEGAALESCRHDLQCGAREPARPLQVATPRFVNGSAFHQGRCTYVARNSANAKRARACFRAGVRRSASARGPSRCSCWATILPKASISGSRRSSRRVRSFAAGARES